MIMALRCECGHTFEVSPKDFPWIANPDRRCPSCNVHAPFRFEGFHEKTEPDLRTPS
jgi:hypothetical protein